MEQPSFFVCERWRERRDSYRPAGEPIDPSRYQVEQLAGDAGVKAFVVRHHYAGTYPAARFRFGLFRSKELVGAAVFSHPMNAAVLTSVFGGSAGESVELGRFVLLDDVPANGESWFLAHCRRRLKRIGLRGIVSFCDPIARLTASGELVFPGHIGTIYQASNAAYLGRATARVLRLLPDGRVFSDRALSKLRRRERGWRYALAQLLAAGAPTTSDPDEEWLRAALQLVTRPLRHRGNLRYAFSLQAPALPSQPYPKWPR